MDKNFENKDNNSGQSHFDLPDSYFHRSAASIQNKIEWLEEHRPYSALGKIKEPGQFFAGGFTVPAGYFEKLPAVLELTPYPGLKNTRKENAFRIPENYFETSLQKLMLIEKEGQRELDELLLPGGLKKEYPMDVPEDYFRTSAEKISAELKPEAKVIRMSGVKKWYTAAAAVLVVALGVWIYQQYFMAADVKDCGTLACVDRNDLIKAKHLDGLDDEQLYEIADTKKLEERLMQKEQEEKSENPDSITTEDLLDEI